MLTAENSTQGCYCWQNLFANSLCEPCTRKVSYSLYPRSVAFDIGPLRLRAMSRYTPATKNFIYRCKVSPLNGLFPAQLKVLRQLSEYWCAELDATSIDGVAVVPGHPLRSRLQSDLAWFLAREIAGQLGYKTVLRPLRRKMFLRDRFYPMQKSSGRSERLIAAQKQYFVASRTGPAYGTPRRLLLVDDVCTTGSTLQVCATELGKYGIEVRNAIVLAKVELDGS